MDGVSFLRPPRPTAGAQVRFMTAGSVDDGKSTLIGRLLLDSRSLMQDQIGALAGEGDDLDLASLTDGLEAERAQGITIDVAYRYFATPRTSFVIADAPGHEQYTRNMVTAASVSDVAVIVVDAVRFDGVALLPQTRRHAAIVALMGLDVIVAVNKMDLVEWSKAKFDAICQAFRAATEALGASAIAFVPISAKAGDNVVTRGRAGWYAGPTLIEVLEATPARASRTEAPLRLPVQLVLRDGDARLYAGRLESGTVRIGDEVAVGVSAFPAKVASISVSGRTAAQAVAGDSVTLTLAEERDLGPGGVIADLEVRYARRFIADLCWLDETQWSPTRRYKLRQGTLETQALIGRVRSVRDIATFAGVEASALRLNDIASVEIATRDPLLADRYTDLPGTGAFVLFDPDTHQTAAAGMIREVL